MLEAQGSMLFQKDVILNLLCRDCLMSGHEPGANCSMMNYAGSDQSR